jgi:hypothetical protein
MKFQNIRQLYQQLDPHTVQRAVGKFSIELKEPSATFEAVSFELFSGQGYSGVLVADGVEETSDFIVFMFPDLPSDSPIPKDYDVTPPGGTGAKVYFSVSGRHGYADSGKVQGVRISQEGIEAAKFNFAGQTISGRFEALTGDFLVVDARPSTHNAKGTASMTITPALGGVSDYSTEKVSYSGDLEKPTYFWASKTVGKLPGGQLDIFLVAGYTGEKVVARYLSVVIDTLILHARNIRFEVTEWRPGTGLAFNFECDVTYKGQDHHLRNGHYRINW